MEQQSSSMSLETQMTHFPALAPEVADSTAINASSKNDGIINSFFGNFFRATPSTSATKSAESEPLENGSCSTVLPITTCSTSTVAPNTEITLEEEPSTSSTTILNNAEPLADSKSTQANSPINNHKKLSIRISSMFRGSSESVANAAVNSPRHSASNNSRKKLSVNGGLKSYKQSEFRRYWMPDATGRECYECYEKFNAFRRRHHCRLCGQIFCGRCSNRQVNGADLGYSGVLRLCNFCANQVETHIKERGKDGNNGVDESAGNENSSSQQATWKETGEKDLSFSFMENVLKKADGEFEASNDFASNVNFNSTPSTSSGGPSPTFSTSENEHLEKLFEDNIERTLDCLLVREHLDPALWRDLLLRLSRKVIDMVIGRVLKVPNALNVLDFVHIKKLQNSPRASFEIIEGVAFSKTLAHTSMPARLENVSLMLLAGNISYERVVEKLSSLEQILLQEHEYLKIQVDRITSRRVSLLLVENSVANLAADMLLAEGIDLVTNIKHRVLERVARATNSDIISSLDAQFLQPRIGFVPDFSQREFAFVDGVKKKILVLNNCIGGLSVLIHGPSLKELIAAKRILKFLLVNRYSSKLEIAFLAMFNSRPGRPTANLSENRKFDLENKIISANQESDPLNDSTYLPEEKIKTSLSQYDNENEKLDNEKFDCALCDFNRNCEAWNDPNPSDFMRQLRAAQLTNSPAIRFAPPFFETSKGRASPILPFFKSPLFRFLSGEELDALKESDEKLRGEILHAVENCKQSQTDNENLRHCMLEEDVTDPKILADQGRWARFRVQSSFIFRRRHELNRLCEVKRTAKLNELLRRRRFSGGKSATNTSTDQLSPYNCQRISFLYCANARKVTSNARSFCMGPYVLLRQFFFGQECGHKDTSLGVFLMNYCFNADYKCGSCERSMMDHLRRIVHRNSRIEISTYSVTGKTSGNSSTTALEELSMDDLPSSVPNMNCSSIISWRRCIKCSVNSCIIPLSDMVYHLSFAKFIDYLANSTYWISEFPTNNPTETCRHCTFHEHAHFFAHHNFIASFKVFPIRPMHVAFNPMVCRIKTENVLCSDLIEMNYDLNSTASEVFDRALSFFKDFQSGPDDNPAPKIQLSPAAEALMIFVEQFKTTFRSHMGKFDPDGIFKRSKMVNSNNSYYMQSESCLVRCRYFLYSFIIKWNSTKLDSIFQISPVPSKTNENVCGGNGTVEENGLYFHANGKAQNSVMPHNSNCYRREGSSANLLSQGGVEISVPNLPNLSLSNCSSNSSLTSLVNLNSTNLSTLPENSPGKFSRTNSTSTVVSKSPSKISSRSDFALMDNGSVLNVSTVVSSSEQQTSINSSISSKTRMATQPSQQNFHHSQSSTFPSHNAVPVELPTIVNPLPKNLHFELPMNNSTVLVRDLIDGKSTIPDIGSIISYALASSEYEERKQIAGKSESDNTFWEFTFGSEAKSKYSVKVYFAEEFETLRSELFGDGEERFIRSLSRSDAWHPQGGKSGANFFRTEDERFVVKQMLRLELESFKKFGPSYFKYIRTALDEKRMTALCKIYGVYGINVTGKNQQTLKIDVLVMEYLFYNKNVKQIWDLKGSLRNRYASTKTEAPVLLDENLVQDLWGNQLYIHSYSKAALKQAISNDCQFLVDQGIMDYSLLAGVCHDEDEVAIGIVDYVRTFTLDKKVESLVKNALPIAHSPTVVSPELYSKRFFAAIEGYFAEAPDQWTHSDSTLLVQQYEDQQQLLHHYQQQKKELQQQQKLQH